MAREAKESSAAVTGAIDRLFVTPPKDFIAARTALVAELRAAGDVAGAKAVGAARRPPPSAWALNVVAREHAGSLKGYVDATIALGAAQREAIRGTDTAGFEAARRDAGEREGEVLTLAKGAMTRAGLSWTPEVRRRVAQTLHAVALAEGDDRARLLAGRLSADVDPPSDFEALAASLGGAS